MKAGRTQRVAAMAAGILALAATMGLAPAAEETPRADATPGSQVSAKPQAAQTAGTERELVGFAERLAAAWRADLLAATGKAVTATVSTTVDAAGGCDGVKDGNYGFHTTDEDRPWWQVDLGAVTRIDRVVIYNRCGIATERPAHLHLLLSDDAKTWKTVYRHDGKVFLGVSDGKPLVVPLAAAAGRFVRVQLPERTWLHLDEVEVYGTDDPKKNVALNKPADQSSTSEWSPGIHRAAGAGTPVAAPAAGTVPVHRYAAAVAAVMESGRLLAADLRSAGVNVKAFEKQDAEITAAVAALPGLPAVAGAAGVPDDDQAGPYFRARRAVRELALANPLLDFDKLLLIRRGEKDLALPANWESNSSLHPAGYDNELAVLTNYRDHPKLTTLLAPEGGRFVGDVDLHFDAGKVLLSMPNERGRWRVWEFQLDPPAATPTEAGTAGGTATPRLRPLPLIDDGDVDNYDACYLPGGGVMFTSTAPFIGVPCVCGGAHVTNLYSWQPAPALSPAPAGAGTIRRLTFDQDHDWCPTVLPSGRVMYLRWEYSDLPHSNSRRLFQMNPDGTGQAELYGSNSYWPNGVFYAKPMPGHPSKVVGIVTGHHGVPRMGELVIFDPAKGRQEATGVVQRIPGRGKVVEPIIRDALVDGSWPKFLHPFPLSENYVLVSAKPTATSRWGVYLVDTFDNMILLAEMEGSALLEPVPVRRTHAPPVLADKVDTTRADSLVYLVDVYRGGGLAGIPRGTVKKLRLFTYSFSYHGIGGLYGVVGADGPWDVKRVLGTVPVEPDGSAYFRIPANTPVSIQPLDERGHALQIMRSWTVGMPGEFVTCVGCHERQDETPPVADATSLRRTPAEIEPWRGPVRGFSYAREVQPAVDKLCVGCHSPDAGPRDPQAGGGRFDPQRMPDLRGVPIAGWKSDHPGQGGGDAGKFSVGYTELARYIRRPGIESNIHLLPPMDYHASTTELVQMLRKGHHGVSLDEDAWDRLATWIDLNAPFHGTWTEAVGAGRTKHQSERRRALLKLYAGMDNDEEAIVGAEAAAAKIEAVLPPPETPKPPQGEVTCPGWPFDAEQAKARQQAAGLPGRSTAEPGISPRTVDLGEGLTLELVPVPAGQFVMGSPDGHADERPAGPVRIDRPFWIGRLEVTNEQYARFDPLHDSGVESKHGYQFGVRGYALAGAKQPVVRVSWRDAMAFCQWLTSKAGGGSLRFTLPTEAQWEYACRAGSAAAFSYGGADVDFSKLANLGDAKLRELAGNPYTETEPMKNPNRFDDWVPKDDRFNDGALVSVDVGTYKPNAWGLHDMHGNVAEWTRSLYRPYPYRDDDGRNALAPATGPAGAGDRVVRGGSWYDRPKRCTSSFRLAYPPYQGVFNVGFRVVAEESSPAVAARTAGLTAEAQR